MATTLERTSTNGLRGLRCRACHVLQPADERYVCGECYGPIEPEYDLAAFDTETLRDEIAKALRTLPEHRTPTKADWAVLSRSWKDHLRSRIEELETLQTRLTSCIGCGCLSLKTCSLLNTADKAADLGSGARYLLGDAPEDED